MGLCSHHKAALGQHTFGPPQLLKQLSVVDSYQVGEQAATTGCTFKHGAQPVHSRAQCTGCKAIIDLKNLVKMHSCERLECKLTVGGGPVKERV